MESTPKSAPLPFLGGSQEKTVLSPSQSLLLLPIEDSSKTSVESLSSEIIQGGDREVVITTRVSVKDCEIEEIQDDGIPTLIEKLGIGDEQSLEEDFMTRFYSVDENDYLLPVRWMMVREFQQALDDPSKRSFLRETLRSYFDRC